MPELPEVESVRRGVESYVVGKEITAVDIAHPRANRGQDEPLAGLVVGKEIAAVARRGKFMWLEFVGEDPMDSHRDVLFIHLGMSGQLRIGPTDSPHRRITVGLSDGTELHFVDQRTFGYWLYAPWSTISHIGLDPLEPDFDIASAARRLRQKKTAVKTALLDQTLVSGIGNIYADEALWAARISPRKKASALRQKDAVALLAAAQTVMSAALKAGERALILCTSTSTVNPAILRARLRPMAVLASHVPAAARSLRAPSSGAARAIIAPTANSALPVRFTL